MLDEIADADNLIRACKRIERASGWKQSTQQVTRNRLRYVAKARRELLTGSYQQGAYTSFVLHEQGRKRLVRALQPYDMMVQHAIYQVLAPVLQHYMIHDNGASIEGKGISFTRRRFEQHLSWHYRRYGRDGYVLKIDFRKYFDNIPHAGLLKSVSKYVDDTRVLDLLERILKASAVDVSDSPLSIEELMAEPFDSLKWNAETHDESGKRFLPKGLGIGSPLSQIFGIFYPTPIDTYCKTVRRLHCYDAYMDDRIILSPSKEELADVLENVKRISGRLGLFIHPRKTQIVKLSHGFTFLKTRYTITPTGRIIRGIPHDVVTRERRKLKALYGKIPQEDLRQQYNAWIGDKGRYNAYRTLSNLDNFARRLFA